MTESSPVQPQNRHVRWSNPKSTKFQSVLKEKRKIHFQQNGTLVYDNIKPQDHGIKKALAERPLLPDTSLIMQRLIVDILHTTTEKNVKELILTAMNKIKFETELFTKQLERHIVEAEKEEKNDYRELTEVERVKIKERDGYACLCCGANTKSKLEIGYIKPLSWGGEVSVENSQTLCVTCNKYQRNNQIDFRCKTAQLSYPKNIDLSFIPESPNSVRTITRIVNTFYRCRAVYQISVSWEASICTYKIFLHPNNNPEWLLQHQEELLQLAKNHFGCHIQNIKVIATE
jgi:hypothetical protein